MIYLLLIALWYLLGVAAIFWSYRQTYINIAAFKIALIYGFIGPLAWIAAYKIDKQMREFDKQFYNEIEVSNASKSQKTRE